MNPGPAAYAPLGFSISATGHYRWPFSSARQHDKEIKAMAAQLDKLPTVHETAAQKKHEAEQQEKRIRKQISDLKDKEFILRFCTHGACLNCRDRAPRKA